MHIDGVNDREDAALITARARAADAACHRCGVSSAWVNSRYRRRRHYLAAGGGAVTIDLEVRRFFCGNQVSSTNRSHSVHHEPKPYRDFRHQFVIRKLSEASHPQP
jgi:hypothetical protein